MEGNIGLNGIQDVRMVVCVEKCKGYVVATLTGNEQQVLECSLEQVEALLPEDLFFRVHKGFIVRLTEIVEINYSGFGALAILSNGKRIPISKRRKNDLLHRITLIS